MNGNLELLTGDTRDAWRQFERGLRANNRSARTIGGYLEGLAHFQKYLTAERGGLAVIDAGRADAEEYLAWMLATPRGARKPRYASGSAANRYRTLVQWSRFLADEEIGDDYMTRVKGPAQNSAVPRVLTDIQCQALIAACRPIRGKVSMTELRDAVIIRIFLEVGSPRVHELAGLEMADFNADDDTITLHGKGNLDRVIPMGPDTARAWFRYKRARAQHAHAGLAAAWLGERGAMGISGIQQMLARRGRQAGIPFRVHPHMLRHTSFADFDAASGGHINAEMALYGWRSPQMAHHYGKAARARQAIELARQMNRTGRLAG